MPDEFMKNNTNITMPFTENELFHLYGAVQGSLAHIENCKDYQVMFSVALYKSLLFRIEIAKGQLEA